MVVVVVVVVEVPNDEVRGRLVFNVVVFKRERLDNGIAVSGRGGKFVLVLDNDLFHPLFKLLLFFTLLFADNKVVKSRFIVVLPLPYILEVVN